ncbi:hypothetical protein LPTSP4_23560 [Leptospira ryugenii]|uniref:Uncharacterized protein n=1 Tax=Leptospira ryugenii TaxID=1917863 RepID=A0A2P2E1T2_9LEPT|nr:hypothetical protein [Leptospira ryugenii]GBF50829.1 hypothetical protein LPTSP4_23560 [Leptospira ryugenii]
MDISNLPIISNWKEFQNSSLKSNIEGRYQEILSSLETAGKAELLQKGIQISLLASILRLIERGINPTLPIFRVEYLNMMKEIEEIYFSILPQEESNWLEECLAYGDKKAYHWDWKHFGSKELF